MQLLQLRKLTHATPFERCRLNDPLVGGMTWTQEMGKRIVACTGAEFEGPIAASMTFYAAGRMYRTDWFRSQIHLRQPHRPPSNPATCPPVASAWSTRKKAHERRREFAQDVTADIAPRRSTPNPTKASS